MVGGELQDAQSQLARHPAALATLQAEVDSVRKRAAQELENERTRYTSLETANSQLERERGDLENALRMCREKSASLQAELEASATAYTSLSADLDRATM